MSSENELLAVFVVAEGTDKTVLHFRSGAGTVITAPMSPDGVADFLHRLATVAALAREHQIRGNAIIN